MNKFQRNSHLYRRSEDLGQDSSNEEQWVHTASKHVKSYKKRVDLCDPSLRVVVYSKVMTFCLPPELTSHELIKSDNYFGRYGKVTGVVLNTEHPSNDFRDERQEGLLLQAFITYENEIDASLAIFALQGYNHCGLWTKTSYGSVKYCQKFLSGLDCETPNCYYIHKKSQEHHISCKVRDNYRNHLAKAREVLKRNIKYIVQKQIELEKKLLRNRSSFLVNCTCVYEVVEDYVEFPAFTETIDKMVTEGVVTREYYNAQKALLSQTKKVIPLPLINEAKTTPKKVILNETDYPSLSDIKANDQSNTKSNQKLKKKPVYVLKTRSRSQAFQSINPQRQQITDEINPELSQLVHSKLLLKTIIRGLQPRSRFPFAAGLNQKAVNADCLKYNQIISQTMII